MPQAPAVQVATPFVALHALVQLPQRVGSVFRFVSQPLAVLPSQLAKPVLQVMPQTPALHEAVPFVALHALLQLPQRVTFVFTLISQPFAVLRSQFANPELQVIEHRLLLHVAVPFAVPHALLQAPQCSGLPVVIVSQPLAKLPSQLPKPALQTMLHAPALHAATPFVDPQTVPQAPQFDRLLDSVVSQPFATLLSQLPKPALQLIPQLPFVQLAVPFVELQAFVQLPQRLTSVLRLRSQPFVTLPSQFPKPALHVIWQAPDTQLAVPLVVLQALLQLPQFEVVVRLVSHPFARLPSQLPKPALHVMLHTPELQDAVPLFVLQGALQAPQCEILVWRLASQPLFALPSQFPKPALQVMLQAPLLQLGVPFVVLQALPQPPQLLTVVRLISQPLAELPSQSAKPAAHAIWHEPLTQDAVPFVELQVLPHVPQFEVLVRLVSQPLPIVPSQLPKPASQAMLHKPPEQAGVP
jgi:hypothetical protein